MKILHFENHKEFAKGVSDMFSSLESAYSDISIIAKYDDAKEILKELLYIGFDISSINLESNESHKYNDEYIISILNIDGENSVWCDKFKSENKYLDDESVVTFIMDNCSSKAISHCKALYKYEVGVGVEDDNVNSKKDINYSDDMHGFTVSSTDDNRYRSFSYYSSDQLSQNDIQDMLKCFGFSLLWWMIIFKTKSDLHLEN